MVFECPTDCKGIQSADVGTLLESCSSTKLTTLATNCQNVVTKEKILSRTRGLTSIMLGEGGDFINKQKTIETQDNLKSVYDKHMYDSNSSGNLMKNTLSKMAMQHADNLYRFNKYSETINMLKSTIIYVSVVLLIYSLLGRAVENVPYNVRGKLPSMANLQNIFIASAVLVYYLILRNRLKTNFSRKSYDWHQFYWGQPHLKVDCSKEENKDKEECKNKIPE